MTHNSHLAAETPQHGLTRTLKIGFFKLSGRERHQALGPRQHQSRGSPWGVHELGQPAPAAASEGEGWGPGARRAIRAGLPLG